MKRNIYFFVLTFFLCAKLCYADFDLANTYYSAGNFEKAYAEFFEAAQYGDTDAQQNVGIMYYRGEHVPKSKITAYAWMTLATQNPSYKENGLNVKIYNKFTDEEKKLADEEHRTLFEKFGNEAIQKRLMPNFVGQTGKIKAQRVIKMVRPTYPENLSGPKGTGMVDITFTIDKYGMTRDQVAYYSSAPLFTRAALNALRQFQYEPLMVNGKPVDVNGTKVRFMFLSDGVSFPEKKVTEYINKEREKASVGNSQDKLGFAYLLEAVPSFAKEYKLVDNPNQWYTSAATEGNFSASYFLGRNILYGNMCTADSVQSMGWLLKAARGGISEAQYLLAIESFSGARFEKNEEKGFYWLSKAASTSKIAKIKYAWILSTHPDAKYRNGKLAQDLLAKIEDDYIDKLSLYQARAATAAEAGNFTDAVNWQQKALEDARGLALPSTHIEQQLTSYTNKTPWREAI